MSDPRLTAFLSNKAPEIFHSVQHSQDVWRRDPFDVPEIHAKAREIFERMIERANAENSSGRILLLRGEAGAGKTHLLRSFRSSVHGENRGFFAYMQMTSSAKAYDRYVLQKMIESFDQPYDPPVNRASTLKLLSDALTTNLPPNAVKSLRETDDREAVKRMVNSLTDRLVDRLYLPDLDLDMIRALLFLQVDRPSVKIRVIKYLRAETLSDYDRSVLGDMAPRAIQDDPLHLVGQLAAIMRKALGRGLVVCLDQIEDLFNLDETKPRFASVMDAVKQLGEVPGSVVVLSCLDSFYENVKGHLTASVRDRVEQDPGPVRIQGERSPSEVRLIIARRLRYLYEAANVDPGDDDSTFPIPDEVVSTLKGTTRSVLAECLKYREAAQETGELLKDWKPYSIPPPSPSPDLVKLRHEWNDTKSSDGAIPEDEDSIAKTLSRAIQAVGEELGNTRAFLTTPVQGKPWTRVGHRSVVGTEHDLLVAVCDRAVQGGGLMKQLKALDTESDGAIPVPVRTTDFAASPKSQTSRLLGKMVAQRNARQALIPNTDLRYMVAFFSFHEQHCDNPSFAQFLREEKPLSSLDSLITILALDEIKVLPDKQPVTQPPPEPPEAPKVERAAEKDMSEAPHSAGTIKIGSTLGRNSRDIAIDPADLKRHITFMGGTGSGKTSAALMLIESLLAREIPALLIDRKGDLCGYAEKDAWNARLDDPERDILREHLRPLVEVSVYTPGNAHGRGLRIPLLPSGTTELDDLTRQTVARVAADALANMMHLGKSQSHQGQRAVLAAALEQYGAEQDGASITLDSLVEYLEEPDDGFLGILGNLAKFRENLAMNLNILARRTGPLMGMGCEPLDAAKFFSQANGKTPLSIVSTKFLGSAADVQFWVAQLLMEVSRFLTRHPSSDLQAVLMLDEADLYLPATSQPATKGPIEDLLRRARTSGLSVFLATQSPGDFDYRCRDNIRTWLVGLLTQQRATEKLADMFTEAHSDTSALASQKVGEFHLLAEGKVNRLKLIRNAVKLPSQIPDDRILELAARGTFAPG